MTDRERVDEFEKLVAKFERCVANFYQKKAMHYDIAEFRKAVLDKYAEVVRERDAADVLNGRLHRENERLKRQLEDMERIQMSWNDARP